MLNNSRYFRNFWKEFISISLTFNSLNDLTFAFNKCSISLIQKLKINILQNCFNLAIDNKSLYLLYLISSRLSNDQLMNLSEKSKQKAIIFSKNFNNTKEAQEVINLLPEEMTDVSKSTQLHDP